MQSLDFILCAMLEKAPQGTLQVSADPQVRRHVRGEME